MVGIKRWEILPRRPNLLLDKSPTKAIFNIFGGSSCNEKAGNIKCIWLRNTSLLQHLRPRLFQKVTQGGILDFTSVPLRNIVYWLNRFIKDLPCGDDQRLEKKKKKTIKKDNQFSSEIIAGKTVNHFLKVYLTTAGIPFWFVGGWGPVLGDR